MQWFTLMITLIELTKARILDFITFDHEDFDYVYDEIGNMLSISTNDQNITFGYGELAHAPANVNKTNRLPPRLELNTIYPIADITVNQSQFFNYTTQICCRDNECSGVDVFLDPQESFTESTETYCESGVCTKTIYSGTRFVFEDDEWKKIEDARSLKENLQVVEVVQFDSRLGV